MPLHPAIRLDDCGWIRRSRKEFEHERIRVQRNRRTSCCNSLATGLLAKPRLLVELVPAP